MGSLVWARFWSDAASRCRMAVAGGAFILVAMGGGLALPSLLAQAADLPVLASVRAIHHLSVEEASRSYPVHVTGVVTALSGFGKSFFVQDATGGITVDRTDQTDVHVGDRIDLVGVSNAGYFAPTIISSKVAILGSAPMPPAPSMTYADLVGGAQDSQWVEVRGVVHSARIGKIFDHDTVILGLHMGGSQVKVLLQDYAGVDESRLIDATIRVRGVATTEFNSKRQFLSANLFVPLRKNIDILEAARSDPFAARTLPVRNAFQFGQAAHRVKVAGIVTSQWPGHMLYIQDGEDGIRIETDSTGIPELGTPIEVVGFPAMGEYSPILRGAIFRVTGPPTALKPLPINAKDVITHDSYFNRAKHDGQLVTIQGKVIESHFEGTSRTLILGDGDDIFEARLSATMRSAQDRLPSGTIVQLTGICTVQADMEHSPTSFKILLRYPGDVNIIRKASWWTPTHLVWILAIFAAAMAFVVLWVMVLRQRVQSQTKTIRESEERFRDLAQHDALTGLPNRLMLDERIAACLLRSEEKHSRAAILTIDVDRFKHNNDTYGHSAGDECLRVVASRLRNAAHGIDTIARTGGEEFTLVASALKDRDDADRLASRILDLFHDPVVLGELEIAVAVSIGGAIYPDDGVETAGLLKRSNLALREAKHLGRNRAVFATEELCAKSERAKTIELAIRESLRAGMFSLAYQPVYDAAGSIHRLEALLRTTDERLSELGPAVYIPIAESCGMILPLGRLVLQTICRHISGWRAAGLNPCRVAVNLSASQLLQNGFKEDVLQILDSYDLQPSALEFELTEIAAMTEFDAVSAKVGRLAAAGITFTIDDFGSGSSSLARLNQLPITALKIDRAFVQGLEESGGTSTVMEAALRVAQSLKLEAVAKGVERPEQLALLRGLGCELFQGYLLARPMPASAVAAAFAKSNELLLSAAS